MKYKILHQCNLNQVADLNDYVALLRQGDAVLFYAQHIRIKEIEELTHKFCHCDVFFLISDNKKLSNIDYEKWVELTQLSNAILTWK